MIKEHNGSTWQAKAYSKIVDTTQQVTSFPTVVRPMENTVPSWTIKGNMSQTGTPTPQNPIQPQETGDRTANLFDETAEYVEGLTTHNYTISGLDPNKYYTCSTNFDRISGVSTASLYFGGGASNINGVWSDTPRTFKPNSSGEIIVYIRYKKSDGTPSIIDDVMAGTIWIMINEGSTPLPHEPYGYKIPISSANTTTPIYLGEVQSTRRIKKLVLDGTESWTIRSGEPSNEFFIELYSTNFVNNQAICSHYINQDSGSFDTLQDKHCIVRIGASGDKSFIGLRDSDFPSTTAGREQLKQWLSAQYANGTPVTIWYVLATPTTGILNEPIRKIGNYADIVSGTNLSVTAHSPTTIDVDTTLKPSEMDLTYTGLKMCKRKKRVNGAWV